MSLLSQYLIPAVLSIFALNGVIILWYRHQYLKFKTRYELDKAASVKKELDDSVALDKELVAHDEAVATKLDAVKKEDFADGIYLK